MITFPLRRAPTTVTLAAAVVGLLLFAPRQALAQTALALFERAQAQEQALAQDAAIAELRRVARAYEAVVRQYPTSGHVDNALWQAAQLYERAWGRAAEWRDRDAAVRWYAWLATEYPASPMAKQASVRATALKTAPEPEPAPAPPKQTPAATSEPAAVQSATGTSVIKSITRSALPRGDRITVELSEEVAYTGERVSNPDRVFFDFANAKAAATVAEQIRKLQSPLIKTVRVGSPTSGVTRLVLELQDSPRYSVFPLYSPYRVVVDIEAPPQFTVTAPTPTATPAPPIASPTPTATPAPTTTPASTETATPSPTPIAPPKPVVTPTPNATPAPPPPNKTAAAEQHSPVAPTSTGRGDYSLARQLGLRVGKIVIDPGHGGHDPGALANGVTESELVLDIALRLEKLLEQHPGIEVVLTRRTNEFVPLEERTAIAIRQNADLFLSIHANSHRQSAVRGVETYFLNFATTPDAEAVAARENAASVQTMGTLPAIVKAIYLNNKIEESREFAALLQTTLMRRMKSQSKETRDLGVKQAPFVVLIGAQMPSVLTEIGFITNRAEAGLLKQPAHRQQIAQALHDAVVKYQESLKRVSTSAPARRE